MCASRRALLIGLQVRRTFHDALTRIPDARLIFLTLTVPNVRGEHLGSATTDLYGGFQRLWRTAAVKGIALGYFRGLEVTYNRTRGDFHPHLHVLVFVSGEYFRDRYINRQQWIEYWRRAVKNPSITQVDVRAVKPKMIGGDRLAGAAAEVSKYAVTGKNMIQSDPAETALVVAHIHAGLRGRRLAQFGGLLSKIKKELKMTDAESASSRELISVGDDPSCRCLTCNAHLERHVFCWLNGDYVG